MLRRLQYVGFVSRYSNVFFYYRGPTAATATEAQAERQVEDNTTKALINTLHHGGEWIARSFLSTFAPTSSLAPGPSGPVSCYLQSRPSDAGATPWLIGISVLGEIDPLSCIAPPGAHGRVDAAVHTPGEALALIEVKVVDRLDWQQLRRHAQDAGIPVVPCDPQQWPRQHRWRLVRWAEVFEWASDCLRKARSQSLERAVFLLEQLVEYLDLVGLAPFRGFQAEDFEFMAAPPDERTWLQQAEVKGRLAAFFEALLTGLAPDERSDLGEVKVGQLPLDAQSAWAQTHVGIDGVNLTVELWAKELQLDLVAWRAAQATQFRAWLASGSGDAKLERLSGYEVVFFARRAYDGPSGKPWWQRETFRELARVPASEGRVLVAADRCEAELDPQWEKLAFHLRRSWAHPSVVAAGEAILDEVRPRLVELAPVVDEINATVSSV